MIRERARSGRCRIAARQLQGRRLETPADRRALAPSLWLYILTPVQTATLIVAFGLIVQGYSVWKLRRALDWQKLWPFIAGAAFGVPAGVALLTWSDPRSVRIAIGIILILYSVYAFFRPALKFSGGGRAGDAAVGLLNGALGGLTGLAGILVTIWCNLRGWPKDVHGVPAGRGRDLSDERALAWGEGKRHRGNS